MGAALDDRLLRAVDDLCICAPKAVQCDTLTKQNPVGSARRGVWQCHVECRSRSGNVTCFALGLMAMAALPACSRETPDAGRAVRLVDLFKPESVSGGAPKSERELPKNRVAVRRRRPRRRRPRSSRKRAASRPVPTSRGSRSATATSPARARPTRRCSASRGREISTTAISSTPFEIRLRVSAGDQPDRYAARPGAAQPARGGRTDRRRRSATSPRPSSPAPEFQTYTLTSPAPLNMSRAHQLLIRPTDAANATFDIESIRVITRARAPRGPAVRRRLAGDERGLPRDAGQPLARDDEVRRAGAEKRRGSTSRSAPWTISRPRSGLPSTAAARVRANACCSTTR